MYLGVNLYVLNVRVYVRVCCVGMGVYVRVCVCPYLYVCKCAYVLAFVYVYLCVVWMSECDFKCDGVSVCACVCM